MYRLMIKTHNKTGLSYLCVTRQEDFHRYPGSGVYWTKHLKKHGFNFTTTVLFESAVKDDAFILQCKSVSKELDVVRSTTFANLMEECGNSTRDWRASSDETKRKMREAMKRRWSAEGSDVVRDRYSELAKRNLRSEESVRKAKAAAASEKCKIAKSSAMKEYFHAMTVTDKKSRGESISKGRLAMSKEAKLNRGAKLSESYKTSEPRIRYNERMKMERVGANNPSAHKIHHGGMTFSKRQFLVYCKERKIDPTPYLPTSATKKALQEQLICHHCGFISRTGVGFTRWHGENCKRAEASKT